MKILVVYFSRTGTTKEIAEKISELIKCDIEEIHDNINRQGAKGYIFSGKEAMLKETPAIENLTHRPENYDLIIIGTPVWTYTMASPIRTFIEHNKNNFKSVAFFCTQGSSGDKKTFNAMGEICYKKPIATLTLKTKEVLNKNYEDRVKKFLKQLKLI